MKIAVIGAGSHSRSRHLGVLRQYRESGGNIELAGICDLEDQRAAAAAKEYGFARSFTDWQRMFREARPDACLAITPAPVTASLTPALMQIGVPLLIEKPLGTSLEQARHIAQCAHLAAAPVMVSMNRRFDPMIVAARKWMQDRTLRHLHVTMTRHQRAEPDFLTGTGIHVVDAVLSLAGPVADWSARSVRAADARWHMIHLAFETGATAAIEIMPTSGIIDETYDCFGDGWRVVARSGIRSDASAALFEAGQHVSSVQGDSDASSAARDGSHAETIAFIENVRAGRPLHPTPDEVLPATEICFAAQEQAHNER